MRWLRQHGHWLLTLYVAFVFIQSQQPVAMLLEPGHGGGLWEGSGDGVHFFSSAGNLASAAWM